MAPGMVSLQWEGAGDCLTQGETAQELLTRVVGRRKSEGICDTELSVKHDRRKDRRGWQRGRDRQTAAHTGVKWCEAGGNHAEHINVLILWLFVLPLVFAFANQKPDSPALFLKPQEHECPSSSHVSPAITTSWSRVLHCSDTQGRGGQIGWRPWLAHPLGGSHRRGRAVRVYGMARAVLGGGGMKVYRKREGTLPWI